MDQETDSPFMQFSRVEREISSILAQVDPEQQQLVARKQIDMIRQSLEALRKLLRDYESEEDSLAQSELLHASTERLIQLRKQISEPGLQDVFSSADIAQLSARIEQLSERLR